MASDKGRHWAKTDEIQIKMPYKSIAYIYMIYMAFLYIFDFIELYLEKNSWRLAGLRLKVPPSAVVVVALEASITPRALTQ